MYTPPAFAETDTAILHRVMAENPFALVISTGPEGPLATHLPVMLEDGDFGDAIAGHMARANPHAAALRADPRARIVFSGPHAYISPAWYRAGPAVPTWNYIAVHAVGRIELVEDPTALEAMLARMTAMFEAGRAEPWQMGALPRDFRNRQIKGIVGFRLKVDRLEGKFKLSQNRPPGDTQAVADALSGHPRDADRAVAAAMRQRSR